MSQPSPEAIAAAKEIHLQAWSSMTYDQMVTSGAVIIDRHFERVRNAYKLAASIDRDFKSIAGRLDQLCCDLNPAKE